MGERQYLDDSSVKIAWVGDKLDAKFRVTASLKAVTSRVRTNPKGELVEASCVVDIGSGSGSVRYIMLRVADLVAFRLPVGTTGVSLIFEPKGSKRGETFSVIIDLVGKSLEIIGNRNEVVDLCSWLYMPLWGNV
jgi:hypothetical protein|nr:MAG TPA: Protein of unknown function (DUF938) [Caudoviricetes sp.]